MKSTAQAAAAGYEFIADPKPGYYRFRFGDGYELCLEPLNFGNFNIALYQKGSLLTEKVPALPALKEANDEF